MTIQGSGLAADAVVTIGGAACAVQPAGSDTFTLQCVTAPGAEGAFPLLYNGVDTGLSFQYLAAYTPSVVTFTPTVFSLATSQVSCGGQGAGRVSGRG